MKSIENGIYSLHSGSSSACDEPMDESSSPLGDPIAVVNKVTAGSPAAVAVSSYFKAINEPLSMKASLFHYFLFPGP